MVSDERVVGLDFADNENGAANHKYWHQLQDNEGDL